MFLLWLIAICPKIALLPYLLNSAGIAELVIASDDIDSILMGVNVVGMLLLVGALDYVIFHKIERLTQFLDLSPLAGSDVVFSVLLAALTIQLTVDGKAELGIICYDPLSLL